MLELRQIRYFLAAAEYGSFRKAALALGIQESAISRRVRDLEDELGASLFHRHNGGVCLTVAGQRFVSHARKGLQQIDYGAGDVAAIGRSERGHLKVGIHSSLASGFLSDLLGAYGKGHEGVQVEVVDGDPADHVASIRRLQLDVAFIGGNTRWPDCETEQLWSERLFAVLPSDHALSEKAELGWRDLAGERFIVSNGAPGPTIRDRLLRRFADLGCRPEIHTQYVGRDSLLSLVGIGRGLTVMCEAGTAACFPGTIYRRLLDEILPFCAVWSSRNDNPAWRCLLSLARSMSRSAAGRIIPTVPAVLCASSLPQILDLWQ